MADVLFSQHITTLRHISPHHAVEQRLEIIHMLVDHAVTMHFSKSFFAHAIFASSIGRSWSEESVPFVSATK